MIKEIQLAYEQAIKLKIYEGELVWSRSQTLLIVNTIFLGAIGIFLNQETPNVRAIIALSIFGFFLCIVWLITSIRGFAFNAFWALCARELEENSKIIKLFTQGEIFKNNQPVEFNFIDTKTNLKKRHQRPYFSRMLKFSTKEYLYAIILCFMILYFGLIILSFSGNIALVKA